MTSRVCAAGVEGTGERDYNQWTQPLFRAWSQGSSVWCGKELESWFPGGIYTGPNQQEMLYLKIKVLRLTLELCVGPDHFTVWLQIYFQFYSLWESLMENKELFYWTHTVISIYCRSIFFVKVPSHFLKYAVLCTVCRSKKRITYQPPSGWVGAFMRPAVYFDSISIFRFDLFHLFLIPICFSNFSGISPSV